MKLLEDEEDEIREKMSVLVQKLIKTTQGINEVLPIKGPSAQKKIFMFLNAYFAKSKNYWNFLTSCLFTNGKPAIEML